ncbi:MAG: phosphonopyruvate decarboxylase [Candidatus Latescibacteria bacterium]|nr:phosphonopyruvate decarboxylase [Candidatus Latescibacterota bacterium]
MSTWNPRRLDAECLFFWKRLTYIGASNEGDAVAIAAGAYLGGQKGAVLMQNSGLGNAVSPLTSLNPVFGIPVLGLVSLRGAPGLEDEPQHEIMGPVTTAMLDVMSIPWVYLSADMAEARAQLQVADQTVSRGKTYFLVVRKGTFGPIELVGAPPRPDRVGLLESGPVAVADEYPARADVLAQFIDRVGDRAAVIAITGYTGRELYQAKDRANHLYMVGSMGCASSVGLGLALALPGQPTIVLDGDGAVLMRMGALATNAAYGPANMLHIVFDNHCHQSTGKQRTVTEGMDLAAVARSCGYGRCIHARDQRAFIAAVECWLERPQLTFLYLRTNSQSPDSLGRPQIKPRQVAQRFMGYLQKGGV